MTVSLHFSFFSDKNLNFIGQLFNDTGNIKPWKDMKIEFHLKDTYKITNYQLKSILPNNLIFPISTLQSAIFGFWDLDTNEHLILNHLLLIFKMYIYIARTTGYLNIIHLLIYVTGIKIPKRNRKEWYKKERKNK